MPKAYLAGPGVFRLDAREHGQRLVAEAAEFGLVGLYPLDGEIGRLDGLTGPEIANRIRLANEGLIREADGVIADMTPFRGLSMDPGTACEIGFAYALGKPVVGYVGHERHLLPYLKRVARTVPDGMMAEGQVLARVVNGFGEHVWVGPDGMAIEDFGLSDNLMMSAGLSGMCVGSRSALETLTSLLAR